MTDARTAKIAYLTTPAPGVFLLNLQLEDGGGFFRFEISRAHLANILIDGTALALRDNYTAQLGRSNRVPEASPLSENAEHERVTNGA